MGVEFPIIGTCDRCGCEIPKKENERYFMLKGTNIIFERETYALHYLLCGECRNKFDKWMNVKGVDTT